MLDAFKIKPFDLEPIYASWSSGPRFTGNPKADPPVDDWLKQIKAGCVQRNIPQEYWHKVGQHFMEPKAKTRLDELKKVMAKVHGGKYRWNWKKFKIAMRNMGWNIDPSATETIHVQSKSSGIWWFSRKKDDAEVEEPESFTSLEAPADGSGSFWPKRKNSKSEAGRPTPMKSNTDTSVWITRKASKDQKDLSIAKPAPQPTTSDSSVLTARGTQKPPTRARSGSGETVTTVTHAPTWLINACNALDFLTSEHPKVMSTLSAILITIGTIPTIPAISAGAGGAILASGAAQAVGAIAVGVGSWLKAQSEGQIQASTPNNSASSTSK